MKLTRTKSGGIIPRRLTIRQRIKGELLVWQMRFRCWRSNRRPIPF